MSKLLPKTPTALMVDAGIKIIKLGKQDWQSNAEFVRDVYQAMYAVSGRKEKQQP